MSETIEEFYHDFRQEVLAGATANSDFHLAEFMKVFTSELINTDFIEGFEDCNYKAQRGMRVDGYYFSDDDALDLFIADFEDREELGSLTQTEVEAIFKRLTNFFVNSFSKELFRKLEDTSPEYGLSRQIADRAALIHRVNCILVSERALSERVHQLDSDEIAGIPCTYNIWDITRLQRQRASRGRKEPLEIDFVAMQGQGIPCLPAHLGNHRYQSFLVAIPASILADLYGKYGARLLEQNVRCFLQARGNVNKGIRSTILNEPEMFFAYNNGITATAQKVETRSADESLELTRVIDLQIVNGGQTTASLFHTERKDDASLKNIFVQLKLSVIDTEDSEDVVPKISEYANTQNRINAADFFSNHPYHVRMEEFSRRLWAPAIGGAQRETKWFYERTRGQYADAQSDLTPAEKKKFKVVNPRPQMFTKTDLAKFENVWDEHPRWVNLGAQKNFAQYAKRIGSEWSKSSKDFNEYYFKRIVARAIVFRATEKIVSSQEWYGGYRANIVAYAIALIAECSRGRNLGIDVIKIWDEQSISLVMETALKAVAKFVNEHITSSSFGYSNVTEWCKKEECWDDLLSDVKQLEAWIPNDFWTEMISIEAQNAAQKDAKSTQRMDDGINTQKKVLEVSADEWRTIRTKGIAKDLFTPKEVNILRIAEKIPQKLPTEKQCVVLLSILDKAKDEGIVRAPRSKKSRAALK